ncbi:MAG: hypothetical protein KIT27_09930 [Legionellales bacterium]|nr:hypothetical protein [Legionellales bacterium]
MKQHGFVLISILLLLSFISALVSIGMRKAHSHQQISRYFQHRIQAMQHAELNLQQAESLTEKSLCMSSEIIYQGQRDEEWWKNYALCQRNHARIIIELLSEDPCVLVDDHLGGTFYRVSVQSTNPLDQQPIILQSTFLIPGNTKNICKSSTVTLRSGRLSWRRIG